MTATAAAAAGTEQRSKAARSSKMRNIASYVYGMVLQVVRCLPTGAAFVSKKSDGHKREETDADGRCTFVFLSMMRA